MISHRLPLLFACGLATVFLPDVASAQAPQRGPMAIRVEPIVEGAEGSWIVLANYDQVGSPVLSPDSEWVAFDGHRNGWANSPAETFVCRRDGSDLKRLAEGGAARWSPDGESLLLMRRNKEPWQTGDIVLVNRDGTGERRIRTGHRPEWSPDGKRIAYSVGGVRAPTGGVNMFARVYIADLDRENETFIADGDCPMWSPDGNRLAVCQYDPAFETAFIRVVDLRDGDQNIALLPGFMRASWSPDGKTLLAVGTRPNGSSGAVTFSPDGNALRQKVEAKPLLEEYRWVASPTFSQDGRYVVFATDAPDPATLQ